MIAQPISVAELRSLLSGRPSPAVRRHVQSALAARVVQPTSSVSVDHFGNVHVDGRMYRRHESESIIEDAVDYGLLGSVAVERWHASSCPCCRNARTSLIFRE